jgi:hypothetical protein
MNSDQKAVGLYAVLARDACDFIDMVNEEKDTQALQTLYLMLTVPNDKHDEKTNELNKLGSGMLGRILDERNIPLPTIPTEKIMSSREEIWQMLDTVRKIGGEGGTMVEFPFEALHDAVEKFMGEHAQRPEPKPLLVEVAAPAKSIREAAGLSIGLLADRLALDSSQTVAWAAELIEDAERTTKASVPLDALVKIAKAAGFRLQLSLVEVRHDHS